MLYSHSHTSQLREPYLWLFFLLLSYYQQRIRINIFPCHVQPFPNKSLSLNIILIFSCFHSNILFITEQIYLLSENRIYIIQLSSFAVPKIQQTDFTQNPLTKNCSDSFSIPSRLYKSKCLIFYISPCISHV